MGAEPRRHDRVWLGPGWEAALRAPLAPPLRAAAAAWIALGRPLVATRRDPLHQEAVALGLALPAGRPAPAGPAGAPRRLAVVVDRAAVVRVAPPVTLAEALRSAPAAWRLPLAALDAAARRAGLVPRVHGSLAWQHVSGEPHVTERSDVDLLLRPRDAAALSRALLVLRARAALEAPRLDGEIILPGEGAVAWRELAGGADRLLVKSLAGVALLPRATALGRLAEVAG